MNKNIIVVGANQTGLVFAAFARNAGFDVTVYEAKKQCDVAYDWTDDMVEETFEEVGMLLMPAIGQISQILCLCRVWASPERYC